jgi:DNA-binding GntR family transcriptional regulator
VPLRIALKVDRVRTIEALAALAASGATLVNADPEAFHAIDTAYHESIMTASQNPELMDAYGRIVGRVRAIRYRVNRTPANFSRSQADHEAIVAALRPGHASLAEEILARHVYTSYFAFLQGLRTGGADGRGESSSASNVHANER